MSATVVPSMIVEDIELRMQPAFLVNLRDPIGCDHVWEPHLWEVGKAYCGDCASIARWVNDPRLVEVSS